MDFTMFHHAICLIFFLLPLNVLSQLSPNITLGSFLTAQNDNNSWTSPSGEFAFGFIQLTGGGYLLAIWFNKIPEKTIIWSANRNNLAQEGSRLQLLEDGRFLLNDQTGSNIWDADILGVGVAYGLMLDTGNFVLVSNTSLYLWQSFDTPSDSLLPSQKLFTDNIIVSSLSVTNYSSGRFHMKMQVDGNLVLYTDQNSPYWATNIFGNDFLLVFNQSGPISVVSQNGTSISSVFSNTVSLNQYYQRLTLDYDGVLRLYLYPKSGTPMAWSIPEFLPSNICLRVTQDTGGGVCGYNSLCSFGNDHKVECECPAKYSLIVPSDYMSGCKPDFVAQSCDNDQLNVISNFGLDDMINADWPRSDMEHYQSVSEDWCRQVCLKDCFCVAAVFRDNNCWKKKSPLSNGRIDASIGGKALIKIRLDNSTKQGMSITTKYKKSSKSKTIIIVVCVALSVVALSLCVFITRRRWQKANTRHKHKEQDREELPAGVTQYDFASIKAATEDFSTTNMLGRGGFGEVFKGVLSNEKEIAVKRLSSTSGQGEIEFRNEVKLLAKLQHKGLVRLLGFCIERKERLLVYEFMSNGSLDKVLFVNKSRLDWEMRYKIIKSIAKGLLYLHEDSRLMIIHRDLKASNILLDAEMNAKISDFGMARLFDFDEGEVITKRIAGTFGYMAPEYAMHGLFSVKSDVYSYGVLLLEIISGKKNNSYLTQDRFEDLPSSAYKTWREGKASDLIDHMLTVDSDSRENMMRCIHIALLCVQENVGGRPTMAAVVLMLQSLTLTLPTPSEPGFFSNNEIVVPHWSFSDLPESSSSNSQSKPMLVHGGPLWSSFADLPESSSSNSQSKPMLVHGGRSDRSMNVGSDSEEFS